MPAPPKSLLDRTLQRFRRSWRRAGAEREPLKDAVSPELDDDDVERLRKQVDECLGARGGEVSARARAAELGETYLVLAAEGRKRFLEVLAREYDTDASAVDSAAAALGSAQQPSERKQAEAALRVALRSPRVRLLRQFNELSQGAKFLVDLRAELMQFAGDDVDLTGLDADVRGLLESWFDVGFLDLERITWETPAALLEKLIEYEAVHAIRSWQDLKNRLEVDRRCYAFFHPQMPHEPLIFVEVALVDGMANDIQALLDESAEIGDPEQADTAIFYSISNCHQGLAGVSFGSFLIKRVADDLAHDLPNLKTFATLSPIPGFRGWLGHLEAVPQSLLSEAEAHHLGSTVEAGGDGNVLMRLLDDESWHRDATLTATLEPILMRLCAHYLLRERRGERARDPVAHFHLSNGARVERINWLADRSPRGIEQSAGMMVNYRYQLDHIEKNHEAYRGSSKVTATTSVRRLLKR